jgi:hypothetical protein
MQALSGTIGDAVDPDGAETKAGAEGLRGEL